MERPVIEAEKRESRRFGRAARIGSVVLASALALFGLGLGAVAGLNRLMPAAKSVAFGTTFSKTYAESLGLDWKSVYAAVLDDLDIRLLRIPAYWDEIEPSPGRYDFGDLDWQVSEAAKRGAKIVLAVGLKTPRWPECHAPAWTKGLDEEKVHDQALAMIEATIGHFRSQPAIVNWQIENEPLLAFGVCPKPDPAFLKTEVALAHSLDSSRTVILQDAGESSTWQGTARDADTLGVSLYRIVWDRHFGYIRWPGIASIYKVRAVLAMRYVDRVINTEMQAEPWTTVAITQMPLDRQLAQMNPKQLESNVEFARQVGFQQVYFWGVEWWYWVRTKGHPEIWDAGKSIVADSRTCALGK